MNLWWMAAAGIALGVVYTLSPLAVLCVTALIVMLSTVARRLDGRERDWFLIVFATATLARLVVIGALVLSADSAHPYTVFFGDEWIFKSRPIWLRNIGLDVPISAADFIYAFDETGMSGHLYALALLQALVGDAPYGIHIFNATLYVGAVLTLYWFVRRSFGGAVALGGSAVLLGLPSLFAWSVSVLKEPIYIALAVAELLVVLAIVRAPKLALRVLAIIALIGLALVMEELRNGTLIVVGLGASTGLALAWILQRPVRVWTAAALLPVAVVLALAQPAVQARLMAVARQSVRYHTGHVMTPGVSYKIVDARYYADQWNELQRITRREVLQYAVRATASYVIEPSPRNWQSPMLWAYLPEHLVWLTLVALAPFGVMAAVKRDRVLTALLLPHAAAIMMMVALTSGNIGTLIRHRGLSLPYLVWFSMLGLTAILARVAPRSSARDGSVADDNR